MLNEVKHLHALHIDLRRASEASLNTTMRHKETWFTK
jgi:hypothetical protein